MTKVRLQGSLSLKPSATTGGVFISFEKNGAGSAVGSGVFTVRQGTSGYTNNDFSANTAVIPVSAGDYFELRGELLHLPPGQPFSIYSLAAILPLLPAKQREVDPNDWMATDAEVACPDPNCPTRFRISRIGKRRFRHGETTAVPLPKD